MAKGSRNLEKRPRISKKRKSCRNKLLMIKGIITKKKGEAETINRNEASLIESVSEKVLMEAGCSYLEAENCVVAPPNEEEEKFVDNSISKKDIMNTECSYLQEEENFIIEVDNNSVSEKDLMEAGCSYLEAENCVVAPPNEEEEVVVDNSISEKDIMNTGYSYLQEEENFIIEVDNNSSSNTSFFPTGRRFIDVGYWFKTLMNHKHVELFNCSFENMKIMKERRRGFHSTFFLKCEMCCSELELYSEDPGNETIDINTAAVSAMITTGGGWSQLAEISAVLNIPEMSRDCYLNCQSNIFDAVCKSSLESMKKAGMEESFLAKESGDVDEDGTPLITVIADGAWSKRSYRTNYNAASGVACIIGKRTKKLLFLGVRNKYCTICTRAESLNKEPTEHICYKNWAGSSTSMETDIIVQGFKASMEMHGIKYARLVGDGDSSVYSKLVESKPYGKDFFIEKIECINHLLRGYGNKLRDLVKKQYSSSGRHVSSNLRSVVSKNINRLRLAISSAVKYRQQNIIQNHNFTANLLKRDILNSPSHVFGEHKECTEIGYFCTGRKKNESNWVPEMKSCGLYQDICSSLNRLAYNAKSLLHNMDNNTAEHYNSVLAKFVGGKRINFSKRGSYQLRCHAAAISVNSRGHLHSVLHHQITSHSPGKHTKKYIRNKIKTLSYKSRRKLNFIGQKQKTKKSVAEADEDYGLEKIPDLESELYESKKELFLTELRETDIYKLEAETRDQGNNAIWRRERRKRITSSLFGKICKMRNTTSCASTVKQIVHNSFFGNKATQYGTDNEPHAREQFEDNYKKKVKPCGLIVDPNYFYLGTSPDGLVDDNALIEIKCPYNASKLTPEEAIIKKKVNFATIVNNEFNLKRNHDYYYQVQGQLNITKRLYCYFIFWTPLGMLVDKIERDEHFWSSKMQPVLEKFYFHCILPEIIDSRVDRNMKIRESEYRLKGQ